MWLLAKLLGLLLATAGSSESSHTLEVAEGELGNVGSASSECDPGMEEKVLKIHGLKKKQYLAGVGISPRGDKLTLKHNSGTSLTHACKNHYGPWDLTQLRLIQGYVSFDVDLSNVGCACNLAFYLVSAPARDVDGIPIAGNNTYAPGNYYCDANKVGGQWCPEVDIMEANNHAFQATPHKCDAPVGDRHYDHCDRAGCAQNTKYQAKSYGPGSSFKIDTRKPFNVRTEFHGEGSTLTGMTTILKQEGRTVVLDHSNCDADYLAALSMPMAAGMSLRITYWGDKAKTMSWMDSPPCGKKQECKGDNAGLATISNVIVKSSPPSVMRPKLPKPTKPPASDEHDCSAKAGDWHKWPAAKIAYCCAHGNGISCASSPLREGPIRWANHPEKCLTVARAAGSTPADSDYSLIIWDCQGGAVGASQRFVSKGDGLIRWAAHPHICADVGPQGKSNGQLVRFEQCQTPVEVSGLQTFVFPSESTKIHRQAYPGMCFDVMNHSKRNGNRVQLWECIGDDDDQIFTWEVSGQITTTAAPTTTTPPPTSTALPAATVGSSTAPATSTTLTTTKQASLTLLPPGKTTFQPLTFTTLPPKIYDCFGNTPRDSWSYRKKLWCCRHMNQGCPVRIPSVWVYDPVVGYPAHIRVLPKINGPRTNGMLNPGDIFRVSQGLEGADGILYLKLADGRGWFFDRMPGVGVMSVEYRAPKASSSDLSCAIWYPGIENSWTSQQRKYCCQQAGRGCKHEAVRTSETLVLHRPMQSQPLEETTVAPQFQFDCDPGYLNNPAQAAWTPEERSWCCLHVGLGCTTTTMLMPSGLADCPGGAFGSPDCQAAQFAGGQPITPAYAQAYAVRQVWKASRRSMGSWFLIAMAALGTFGSVVFAAQRYWHRQHASFRHELLREEGS